MGRADELAGSIVHRYLALKRYVRHFSSYARKTYKISGRQLAVLRYLVGHSPCTVGEISRFLEVRNATASPLLERMERDGHVTRRRCRKDNRRVLVEPTESGRTIAARAPMGPIELMRVKLPELPLEELEEIDGALRKLSDVARVNASLLDEE